MAFFDAINTELQTFISQQSMFFTGTAPTAGRINISPKGMDSFRCLGARRVAYLDLTGSGNETAAHLRQNGRMTVMFCSFAEKPLILRLYGKGTVIGQGHERWAELSAHFPEQSAVRQVILMQVESVQTSCGFGVPVFELVEERKTLSYWGEKKSPEDVRAYWRKKNVRSIDGLETGIFETEELRNPDAER